MVKDILVVLLHVHLPVDWTTSVITNNNVMLRNGCLDQHRSSRSIRKNSHVGHYGRDRSIEKMELHVVGFCQIVGQPDMLHEVGIVTMSSMHSFKAASVCPFVAMCFTFAALNNVNMGASNISAMSDILRMGVVLCIRTKNLSVAI